MLQINFENFKLVYLCNIFHRNVRIVVKKELHWVVVNLSAKKFFIYHVGGVTILYIISMGNISKYTYIIYD